ncbi:MAG: hypothetical protein M1838_006106 [Thelocarpon superellum]|nr:MAG: hypothetical protein M1838_006106 [Thelocarpon superellum]
MRAGHKTPDSIPFFPAQKLDDVAQTPYTIWDFFPPAWTCPWDMQRVGQLGDGGKWVCGMSLYEEQTDPPTVMYSFGVNNRSTFEAEMLVRSNVEIFAFDHSTEGLEAPLTAEQRSRVQFMKLVLGGEDQLQREPPIYTLNTLMQLHEHEYIDILKIDIEGAEYAALDAVMNEFQGRPLPLGQVIISMHLEDKTDITFPRFYEWWERLESYGMRATSFEVDLLAITTSAQKRNPDRVEYVWVNTQDPQSILLREL